MIEEIKNIKSKEERDEIMSYFLHEDRFTTLIKHFISKEKRLSEKTSWILHRIDDLYPEQLWPYCNDFVKHLPYCQTDAEKRFTMRYFMTNPLPEDEENLGILMNISFNWLADPKEAIATRANAMTVLYRISKRIPEISNELISLIEDQAPHGSGGFKNRAKHTLKKLKTI